MLLLAFQVPETEEEWKTIELQFRNKWDFHHCCGAIDGKHINLKPPPHSGSYFYNYKGNFSIVLLAVVDANYKFIMVDVGCNGRISDGGVLKNSNFGRALENKTIPLPMPEPLPGLTMSMPYVFVGDDAFPLAENMMKPYALRNLDVPSRVYNYRLSRARRVSENAFGILTNRFRVLLSRILVAPEKAQTIVLAACTLHNFLRTRISNLYTASGSLDTENLQTHVLERGEWRHHDLQLQNINPQGTRNATQRAKNIRDQFRFFFNSTGQVPWQWNVV